MKSSSRHSVVAYGLLAPAFLLVGGFVLYPLYVVIVSSLRVGRTPNIARLDRLPLGIGNFTGALTDAVVWHAARITLVYVAAVVMVAFPIGLGLALLLDRDFPARRWIRTLMLMPWAVPGVVAAITFLWMFDASYGVVNAILRDVGLISTDVAWFTRENTALATAMLPAIWKCFPFFVLTLLAALQAVPEALHEAAKVDGATGWQRFRFVTWPGIRGPAILAIILQALWVMKDFDILFVATGGGPSRATQTLSLLVYEEAFQFFRIGYASAIGILLLVLCAAVAFLSLRASDADAGG
jgi:multiple sugar transport system permease protein